MKNITIIRHPESEANGNLDTHMIAWWGIDVGLSLYGQRSIEKFGDFYKWKFIDHVIVSSPMQRCRDLVSILSMQDVHASYMDERLQERDFGIHTGKTKKQMLDFFQKKYPNDNAGTNFSEWMNREWLWFESNRLLKNRVADCLCDVQSTFPDKDIVLITHTGVIRALISCCTGVDEWDINAHYSLQRIDNLSISQFEKNGASKAGRETIHINHIPDELTKEFSFLKRSL